MHRYGPLDFFFPGVLKSHVTVESHNKAHVEVKRNEQLKSLVCLAFIVDYLVSVVPFLLGTARPLTLRWTRWMRPVYMILTSRELRRWAQLIVASFPSTIGLAILLFMVLSVYAVIGTLVLGPYNMYENYNNYTADTEDTYAPDENFKTYMNSMVMMYVLMTAENYPTITYAVYRSLDNFMGTIVVVTYFISFMFVVTFFLANLALPRIYMEFRKFRDAAKRRARFLSRSALLMCFRMLDDDRTGRVDYERFRDLVMVVRPDLVETGVDQCGIAIKWMWDEACQFTPPKTVLTVEDVIRKPMQFLQVILTEFDEDEDLAETRQHRQPSAALAQAPDSMLRLDNCNKESIPSQEPPQPPHLPTERPTGPRRGSVKFEKVSLRLSQNGVVSLVHHVYEFTSNPPRYSRMKRLLSSARRTEGGVY